MGRPFGFAACVLGLAIALAGGADAESPNNPAIGLYRLSDAREIYVEYLPDIDGLVMVDFPSGRVRPLARSADGAFSFGPRIGAGEPVVATFTLDSDLMSWREAGRVSTGRKIAFRTEDVSFQSGEVRLAGTLTLPRGSGPFPAVVLMHGGGAQTRDFFWIPHFFASRGLAVLAYDKRGVGASTGDWRTSSNADLAGDALAGVEWLRARSDIRANRIGLYGSSAGGWTAPMAAARAPNRIAFVIARSASALPERANVIYEIEGDLRSAGFGDDEVAAMRRVHELALGASDAQSWERFREGLASIRGAPWFRLVRLPADLPAWNDAARHGEVEGFIATLRRDASDPLASWRQLSMPILIQEGGLDRYVPGPLSTELLRTALSRNHAAHVVLYPRGDHPMFESSDGYPRSIPAASRYAEGYLTDLDAFARRMTRSR
ncbi:MAG TPA: alpha/beta fold hydrolase [Caulobacterales bacterium]|nr:alpha/beta fold hydrolase [Caulobacterales bacterium]